MGHDGALAAEQSDTTPRARARYLERLRAASPRERLARTFELSRQARAVLWAALKRATPEASDVELKVAFVRRLYGDALADQLAGRLSR